MSGTTAKPTVNRLLIQQSPVQCDCKTVLLQFLCGHTFVRVQLCTETIDLHQRNQHPQRDVILKSPDICAECKPVVSSTHDELAAQVAAGELSEHESPPKNNLLEGYDESEEGLEDLTAGYTRHLNTELSEKVISFRRGSSESSAATVLHHEAADPVPYTNTYLLPATTYDPHAPGNISTVNYQNRIRAFERQGQVASWVEGTNEGFDIDSSTRDLLFEWLRSEILQNSGNDNEDRDLVNPISPLQYLDDPYDTSASSCARTSDGTVRRYDPGIEVSPATMTWILRNDSNNTGSDISLPCLLHENNLPQLTETRSKSWPIVPIIRITKQGPALSMFGRTRIAKESLTKIVKSSITKSYRIASAKLFTKRGIDGRVLQRQNPMEDFRKGRLLSRNGTRTRAERRVDGLREKMLGRKYAEEGFYQVVAGEAGGSDETDSTRVGGYAGSLMQEVDTRVAIDIEEDSEG